MLRQKTTLLSYAALVESVSVGQRLQEQRDFVAQLEAKLKEYRGIQMLNQTQDNEVRNIHGELNRALALRHALSLALEIERPDERTPAEQVQQILSLPGVTGLQVDEFQMTITVEVRYHYLGVAYDLGTWSLTISPYQEGIVSAENRSGVLAEWEHGSYPSYCLGGMQTECSFCFGNNESEIDILIAANHYVEAFGLAVACLHSVGAGSRSSIPQAFRRA